MLPVKVPYIALFSQHNVYNLSALGDELILGDLPIMEIGNHIHNENVFWGQWAGKSEKAGIPYRVFVHNYATCDGMIHSLKIPSTWRPLKNKMCGSRL